MFSGPNDKSLFPEHLQENLLPGNDNHLSNPHPSPHNTTNILNPFLALIKAVDKLLTYPFFRESNERHTRHEIEFDTESEQFEIDVESHKDEEETDTDQSVISSALLSVKKLKKAPVITGKQVWHFVTYMTRKTTRATVFTARATFAMGTFAFIYMEDLELPTGNHVVRTSILLGHTVFVFVVGLGIENQLKTYKFFSNAADSAGTVALLTRYFMAIENTFIQEVLLKNTSIKTLLRQMNIKKEMLPWSTALLGLFLSSVIECLKYTGALVSALKHRSLGDLAGGNEWWVRQIKKKKGKEKKSTTKEIIVDLSDEITESSSWKNSTSNMIRTGLGAAKWPIHYGIKIGWHSIRYPFEAYAPMDALRFLAMITFEIDNPVIFIAWSSAITIVTFLYGVTSESLFIAKQEATRSRLAEGEKKYIENPGAKHFSNFFKTTTISLLCFFVGITISASIRNKDSVDWFPDFTFIILGLLLLTPYGARDFYFRNRLQRSKEKSKPKLTNGEDSDDLEMMELPAVLSSDSNSDDDSQDGKTKPTKDSDQNIEKKPKKYFTGCNIL